MPIYVLLERILLFVIGLILFSQIVVIAISAIITNSRRNRPQRPNYGTFQPEISIYENNVKIYTYGMDLFHAMLRDIEAAKSLICLESFIWKNDQIGQEIKDALTRKAIDGVSVFVIFDGFANLVVPSAFKRFPDPVHVIVYRSWRRIFDVFDPRRLARDHRKLLVIDRRIGYTGGYNIGHLYGEKWRDTHVRLEGSAAQNLYASFSDLWNELAGRHSYPLAPAAASIIPNIRLYENNPVQFTFPIRSLYIDAIDLAGDHIYLTTPYFIPDRYVLRALIHAARRGVNVLLIIPERSNHLLADLLARTYFTKCLRDKIRVFLYQDAMIHAKTATIDGHWTTVGTANLDRLSLIGNYEINMEFLDDTIAQCMEIIFHNDLVYCRELQLSEWSHRPLLQKLGELVLSPLWPFL